MCVTFLQVSALRKYIFAILKIFCFVRNIILVLLRIFLCYTYYVFKWNWAKIFYITVRVFDLEMLYFLMRKSLWLATSRSRKHTHLSLLSISKPNINSTTRCKFATLKTVCTLTKNIVTYSIYCICKEYTILFG